MNNEFSERFPSLRAGLKQMGREGCERALEECKEHPEIILCDGRIWVYAVCGEPFMY